ncbi:MAG: creatininase family protein, partial [Candidatus Hydrogenedentota bacterium]
KYGITPGEAGTHAGHLETSVMLADYPDIVDMERATRGKVDLGYDAEERLHREGMLRLSPVGILGDATRSNAEAGKDYNECLVNEIVKRIRSVLSELSG